MYNVVFVYTAKAGGYEGVVTRISWPTKEDFQKDFAEWSQEIKEKQRVLEEGVSQERAIELVEQTPKACRTAATFQELGKFIEALN